MENCTNSFKCLLKLGYLGLGDVLVCRFVCREFNENIIKHDGPCRLIYTKFRTKTKILLIPQMIREERYCDCHQNAMHIMRRKPKTVVTQEGIIDDVYCHYFRCKYKNCGNVLSANPNLFKDDIDDIFIVCGECRKKAFSNPSRSQKSFQIGTQPKKPKLKKSMSRSWSGFSTNVKKSYDDVKEGWEKVLEKAEEKPRNRSSFNMKDIKSFRQSLGFGESLETIFA